MALVLFTDSPKITDTILFEITTPDAYDCLTANPYKVDRLVVYYVERDFLGSNFGEYEKSVPDPRLEDALRTARDALCIDPSPENIAEIQRILDEIESSSQKTTFYYKDRVAVKTVGSEGSPAWIASDSESLLVNTDTATFTYEWNPDGSIREGDYFVCWTWTPLMAGEKLSAHVQFQIAGDPSAVTAIPTHVTAEGKYETLLERYLPEMYKQYVADLDVSPEVLDSFNQSVANGFTFIEDQANQVIDLFDANALHETLLVYLGNLFGLKLKSDDPTLWRRQIKRAIPLYKKKGTLGGLSEAFAQAGMTLDRYVPYWQIVSPYTRTESFQSDGSNQFKLAAEVILPIDGVNFALWLKRSSETEYTTIPSSYVSFETGDDGVTVMTWVADQLSGGGVELFEGDYVKVRYVYHEVPGSTEQQIENYFQSLSLADQRDENEQTYPLLNWNVRLIDEDDPLFNTLVPVRHPFYDPTVFGWLRTEFAYSENIYNMEEWNGSTRPSTNPCDIDKDFLDVCSACLSSSYSVDIGVKELSNDRMLEAQEILKEFTPFHTQVHTINFSGEVQEFMPPPVETVETLIGIDVIQHVISGNANTIFHRYISDGLIGNAIVNREELTDKLTVLSGKLGTGYNDHVAFVSPDHDLAGLGLGETTHILEVLAPSGNAGTYQIDDCEGRVARVKTTVNEPVDTTVFTFNLSNVLYGNSFSTITQDDLVKLADADVDFAALGVKSNWDVEHTEDYAGGPWKVLITAYSATPFEINDVIQNTLVIQDSSVLPNVDTSPISYTLLDDNDEVIETSTVGSLTVVRRGFVDTNDYVISNIHEFIRMGDLLYYDGNEYPILEFEGNAFWIGEYTDGDASGVTIQTRRRLIDGAVGQFGYRGLRLTTFADHEAEFGMINGQNPPPENEQTESSRFKENYLFFINDEYFKIADIDGDRVVLSGREQNWMTEAAGGTVVAYAIVHFPTKSVDVSMTVFEQIDRRGSDTVIREIESSVDDTVAIVALSSSPSSGPEENTTQEEGITFAIQYRSGEIVEGEL
jgi:hypothetical protein